MLPYLRRWALLVSTSSPPGLVYDIQQQRIRPALEAARAVALASGLAPTLQIEVETLEQLDEALGADASLILLDNFDLDGLRAAVRLTAGRAQLEASGGIRLDNVRASAETGVDRISVGSLTKHVRAVDLSMRLVD